MRRIVYYNASKPAFRPFILTVDSGADARFTIPTAGTGYNYSVSTSDGQTFNGLTGNQLILFPLSNTLYDIEIRGLFPRIYVNNNAERLKIKDIKQWGDIVWGAVQDGAFYGCGDMVCSALDLPDMEHITSALNMFRNCSVFAPITFDLKFADLTTGNSMFNGASSFNPPNFAPTLANLTNGTSMFYQATSFNPSNFAPTLENLTNGTTMFYQATSFNPPNFAPTLANLTNGTGMFRQLPSFNPPNFAPTLENLTNGAQMFYLATSFNPPNFAPTLENLTNGANMFQQATSFNPPNFAPTLANLTYGLRMFQMATSFNPPNFAPTLENLTNGANMFYNAASLTTLDLSNADVSSVTNMNSMFQLCSNLISDIDFSDPITGSISLTEIKGMMAGTKSERLLLQAGNLLAPGNIAGNPSNWIASPNMKEVKLFGMPNDVDTTIGYGSAGAMTGEAWKDLLESFDISQAKTYRLSVTAYNNMEAHLQGLGYIDIQDYLTQTGNNWTVIS